jgi:hypothetical protein
VSGIGGQQLHLAVDVTDNGTASDTCASDTPIDTLYQQAGTTRSQLVLGSGGSGGWQRPAGDQFGHVARRRSDN